ncbi:MAG: UDP-N-acetylglucosamine 1-carboxyvinyltransferase [Chloroflexota bacterium]|nr:UDP-N-acetylglucosamine 1-carboxyvinyltransferase [Chloroflexota bacterium]NOG62628.1 UDP-N-acetylglucosamine 1-carboxyvinyltransferase [Chloroflexota bacterium]GIK63163.1 MAG: UDP-N-acetylglucosamine 1-carboxyvinyltransferase [Chloroflexota bacterium]
MRLTIEGQAPLHGDYHPSGNSNAAIATLAASLLTDAPVILRRVPNAQNVANVLEIARQLGASVTEIEPGTLQIQTPHVKSRVLDLTTTRRAPASMLFLAPMIARRRHVRIEWAESLSRIRTHMTALRDLGQEIEIDGTAVNITAVEWESKSILLTEMSVTATALACMLAAALGKQTTIYNAASEPHLRTLQHQLVQMGAKIEGIGSNLLTIYGVGEGFTGTTIDLPSDHIEIASIAAIAAMTEGHITIHDVHPPDLQMILKGYERLGLNFYLEAPKNGNGKHILHIPEQQNMRVARLADETDVSLDTAPWPGFPSDLVAMAAVLATQTRGTTLIHEKLYDNRLLFTDKLKGMGAQILLCDPHRAIVIGKSQLRAEYIDSPDVRTGLGLFAATLCAEGKSTIDNAELMNYVFENVVQKLTALGAQIQVADI